MSKAINDAAPAERERLAALIESQPLMTKDGADTVHFVGQVYRMPATGGISQAKYQEIARSLEWLVANYGWPTREEVTRVLESVRSRVRPGL